jgi:hypothetical protein
VLQYWRGGTAMSRRVGQYERVRAENSDDEDSPPRGMRQRSDTISRRAAYYAESHLSERFEEVQLDEADMRWGLRENCDAGRGVIGSVTSADVKRACLSSFHIFEWLPNYDVGANLALDITAGLTVGVVLVAQGVAYGLLAGLPAYYGLYASIPPAFIYALFGTSRQMHIGPFALVSLLVAEGVTAGTGISPDTDMDAYVDAVMTMSMMCGCIYLVMWACRLGFVVEILSDPTMSAMTTAAAFLICTSQMRHFFGMHGVPRASFLETWVVIISKLPETNFVCLGIGVGSLAIQVAIARLNKKLKLKLPIPEQLIVVVVMTWLVWQFDLEKSGVTIFGEVPTGLPTFYMCAVLPGAPFCLPACPPARLPACLPASLLWGSPASTATHTAVSNWRCLVLQARHQHRAATGRGCRSGGGSEHCPLHCDCQDFCPEEWLRGRLQPGASCTRNRKSCRRHVPVLPCCLLSLTLSPCSDGRCQDPAMEYILLHRDRDRARGTRAAHALPPVSDEP